MIVVIKLFNFWKWIKALLVGILQGFTEVLPVSSSAHNAILAHLFSNTSFDMTDEIFLHIASGIAIFLFLSTDIYHLFKGLFIKEKRKKHLQYIGFLIIASIPALITWILFENLVNSVLGNLNLIGGFLLVTSMMLFLTTYNLKHEKNVTQNINLKSSIGIGIFQGLAVLPGISRSGSTLFSGIYLNKEPKSVIKFSLYLYLIASIGSIFLNFSNMRKIDFSIYNISSFIVTLLITYLSVFFLYNKFTTKHYRLFGIYTFILGIVTILFL